MLRSDSEPDRPVQPADFVLHERVVRPRGKSIGREPAVNRRPHKVANLADTAAPDDIVARIAGQVVLELDIGGFDPFVPIEAARVI